MPYRAFVQELHARILTAGGRPEFWAGDTSGQFALHLLGMIVAACVAVGIVISDRRLPGWGLIAVATAFCLYGWPLVGTLRANETRRYNPHAIPENLLPQDSA